jgi:transposase
MIFCQEQQNKQIEPVFIDEFSCNLSMTPKFARSKTNTRAIDNVPSRRGTNVSVVMAMTRSGLKEPMMLLGSMDGAAFQTWLVQRLLPKLVKGMVVFLDNVRFHTTLKVQELFAAVGCDLVFLPAYSPDLNAIEEAISQVKNGLRRLKPRDSLALERGLGQVLKNVSPKDAIAYIAHAGYQLVGV